MLFIAGASAQQDYETAIAFYERHKYGDAAQCFANVWRVEPKNATAGYYAAYSFYLAGKREQSVTIFWQLVNTLPDRKESGMARELLKRIDPDYAKHSANSTADASPQPAKTSFPQRRIETAQELVDALVTVEPPKGKVPAVTPSFTRSIKEMLVAIPLPVLRILNNEDGHIRIMPSVVEMDYRIQNTTPHGWNDSASWKDSPALCHGKSVVISQYRNDQRTGEYVQTTNELGVVRHELGHAIDNCMDSFSQTESFKHAYYLDAANVPQELRTKLDYFLQSGWSGPSEVFAELCCHKFGGETDRGRIELCELVKRNFPLTDQELEKRLNELK